MAYELICSSHSILLHLHPKPDLDSLGSALATFHALSSIGKKVTIIQGDSVLPEAFSFMPGYEHVVRKNFFEINLTDFDLFIIQDASSKEMISRKGEVVFPPHLKTIVIDHHKTNTRYGDINLVDTTYAATCEYLFDIFTEWGIVITKDIAQCLFAGIFTDTGGFKYSSTTIRTLKIITALAEIYPDFPKIINSIENNNSKSNIYFNVLALSSIETYFNDTVAISSVSFEAQQLKQITREDSNNNTIANTLITVKQWGIGVTLIEKAPNEVSVSLRSKEKDISFVSQKLGGGGHAMAAGTVLKMSLEEAKKKVIEALSLIA